MTTILLMILRNWGTALLTKTFGLWLLKLAVKSTKTTIDDNAVSLIEGGLNNDKDEVVRAAKAILESLEEKFEGKI